MGPALEPATCPSSPGIQLLLLPTPPGPVLRGSAPGIRWPGVACAARETASLRREIRAAPAGTLPVDDQTNLERCADCKQPAPGNSDPGVHNHLGRGAKSSKLLSIYRQHKPKDASFTDASIPLSDGPVKRFKTTPPSTPQPLPPPPSPPILMTTTPTSAHTDSRILSLSAVFCSKVSYRVNF